MSTTINWRSLHSSQKKHWRGMPRCFCLVVSIIIVNAAIFYGWTSSAQAQTMRYNLVPGRELVYEHNYEESIGKDLSQMKVITLARHRVKVAVRDDMELELSIEEFWSPSKNAIPNTDVSEKFSELSGRIKVQLDDLGRIKNVGKFEANVVPKDAAAFESYNRDDLIDRMRHRLFRTAELVFPQFCDQARGLGQSWEVGPKDWGYPPPKIEHAMPFEVLTVSNVQGKLDSIIQFDGYRQQVKGSHPNGKEDPMSYVGLPAYRQFEHVAIIFDKNEGCITMVDREHLREENWKFPQMYNGGMYMSRMHETIKLVEGKISQEVSNADAGNP